MSYSPVRHSMPKHCVRLACIRHAASVHPEPGSNSPLSFSIFRQFHVFLTLSFFLSLLTCLLFSFQCSCRPLSRVLIYNIIYSSPLQPFFSFFFVFLSLFFLKFYFLLILSMFFYLLFCKYLLRNSKIKPH